MARRSRRRAALPSTSVRRRYNALLAKFFAEHTPGESSRQYRSCIFYHDDDQRAAAEAVRDGLVDMGKRWVRHTAVEPAKDFWQAEDYHQK